MATSATTGLENGASNPPPRAPLLRRTRHSIPTAVWYTLATLGFVVLVIVGQIVVHSRRTEPRDARAIVERELRLNTLRPGERVVREVPVFRRSGVDYFRQTRGILALTDRRLIYLGAPPRDITGASDGAPTFDQGEFRIDTLVRVEPSFSLLSLSRALKVETPSGTLKMGIPSGEWQKAQLMIQAWNARHKKLAALGVWGQRVRDARAQLQKELAEYRRQPVYHTVRAGDAVSSIASWYETTPEEITRLNGIVNNRIRVGQRLLIRPGKGG